MYTMKKMKEPILATSMGNAGGYYLIFWHLFPINFPGHKIIPTTETKLKIYTKNSSPYDKITSNPSKTYSCLITPQ